MTTILAIDTATGPCSVAIWDGPHRRLCRKQQAGHAIGQPDAHGGRCAGSKAAWLISDLKPSPAPSARAALPASASGWRRRAALPLPRISRRWGLPRSKCWPLPREKQGQPCWPFSMPEKANGIIRDSMLKPMKPLSEPSLGHAGRGAGKCGNGPSSLPEISRDAEDSRPAPSPSRAPMRWRRWRPKRPFRSRLTPFYIRPPDAKLPVKKA